MCSISCKPKNGVQAWTHNHWERLEKGRTITNFLILDQFFFPPVFFGKLLNYNSPIVSSMHLSLPKPDDFLKFRKPPCSANATTKGKSTHIFKHFKWKLMWFFITFLKRQNFMSSATTVFWEINNPQPSFSLPSLPYPCIADCM